MKHNQFVKGIINSSFIVFILAFFLLGDILYLTWSHETNTITSFLQILMSMNYLTVFVFPIFYIFTALAYKKMNKQTVISRFKTRMEYFKFIFWISLKSMLVIFLYYLLLIIICYNFMGISNYDIENITYSTNLLFLISKLIKILLMLSLFQAGALITYMKFKNTSISGMINLGFYLLLYVLKYFNLNNQNFIIKALNPLTHLTSGDLYFHNWSENIFSTILFFAFYGTIMIVVAKKTIPKIDFLEKE